MTLNEFKQIIDRYVDQHGEEAVVVHMSGIGGSATSATSVTSADPGFDWYSGCFVIHTQELLTRYKYEKEATWLKERYLEKISNLKKVKAGEKTARYRKEEKTFEKYWDAQIWLYEKLREEMKK